MSLIDLNRITGTLGDSLNLLFVYWWIYLPIVFLVGFLEGWKFYIQARYLDSLEWVLLKIKPPPRVDRTLKAVEQIFAGLHGIYIAPVNWKDRWLRGKVPDWFSLEIVGHEGITNFYIRTPVSYRRLVESNIFAQYPEAEISEAEDYMASWPALLPNNEIDLFGLEMVLAKENAYPIQTYPYFEEKAMDKEDLKRIDPLGSVSEIFSTFRVGETFVIQWLIRPVGEQWIKDSQKVLDKIMGKEAPPPTNLLDKFFSVTDKLFLAAPAEKPEEKKEKKLTSGEMDAVKAINLKLAKLGFEAAVRLVYIARTETFHRQHFAAISGAFKQFAIPSLNSFKANPATITFSKGRLSGIFPSDRGFFVEQITLQKKWRIFQDLRSRLFPRQYSVLNIEELATVFHLPGLEVRAPLFPRVEAKKGQPPTGLPLE